MRVFRNQPAAPDTAHEAGGRLRCELGSCKVLLVWYAAVRTLFIHIKGTVQKVKEGMVMAEVVLDIGGGDTITSTISDESVKRIELKVGDEAYAIVKATSVMIGVA